MRLKGKTCVVTAAGQGIGQATVRAFASEGGKVWATDVDETKLKTLAGVDGILVRKLDVLDKAATCCSIAPDSSITVTFSMPRTSSGSPRSI